MRFSLIALAASAGLVAAQTDPAGQCIQTCFDNVGQDNPNSPEIKQCQALADGLQQLLCLCQSAPLVDAFSTCAGQTCPDLAAQVNGAAICEGSSAGASNTNSARPSNTGTGSGAVPSNTGTGAGPPNGAGPSNTASGAGAAPSNSETGAGPSNTAGASNTDSGAPAPGDAGNGASAGGVAPLYFVVGGAFVSGLLV